MNNKKTWKKIASLASEILRNDSSSKIAKKLAWSALSQVNKKNQTWSELEDIASQVLRSNKYNDITESLAASVLSQSNKSR